MKKLLTVVLSLVAFIGFSISTANAKTLKCQTVISAKADEVKMLKDFGKDVSDLTRKFEKSTKAHQMAIKYEPENLALYFSSFYKWNITRVKSKLLFNHQNHT